MLFACMRDSDACGGGHHPAFLQLCLAVFARAPPPIMQVRRSRGLRASHQTFAACHAHAVAKGLPMVQRTAVRCTAPDHDHCEGPALASVPAEAQTAGGEMSDLKSEGTYQQFPACPRDALAVRSG